MELAKMKPVFEVIVQNDAFRIEQPMEDGMKSGEARVVIESDVLRMFMRNHSNFSRIYMDKRPVPMSRVMSELDTLTEVLDANKECLDSEDPAEVKMVEVAGLFLSTISDLNREWQEFCASTIASGYVTFEMIPLLFKENTVAVMTERGNHLRACRVSNTTVEYTFFGVSMVVRFQTLEHDGKDFGLEDGRRLITAFEGKKKIEELSVRPITEEETVALTKRGHRWAEMVQTHSYRTTDKPMWVQTWFGETPIHSEGRCMADNITFCQQNPGSRPDLDRELPDESLGDHLVLAPVEIPIFSFRKKRWGKVALDDLKEIEFREDAYEKLVLDQETKDEIRGLVEHSTDMFTDVIDGKGGGSMFLLHGSPGLGKTLTAESVAELLKRPLYMVGIGELGTTPESVESNLEEILEIAGNWNAVVLLDEADIFLEARTKDDIERNAMVGVFLRKLEYHNGVMFLTTNRVENFDPAILSRISVIIRYPDFTDETRIRVWQNILASAGIADAVDADYMGRRYSVNGRQIKNAIRTAMTTAKAKGEQLQQSHVERVVRRTEENMRALVGANVTPPAHGEPPLTRQHAAA